MSLDFISNDGHSTIGTGVVVCKQASAIYDISIKLFTNPFNRAASRTTMERSCYEAIALVKFVGERNPIPIHPHRPYSRPGYQCCVYIPSIPDHHARSKTNEHVLTMTKSVENSRNFPTL